MDLIKNLPQDPRRPHPPEGSHGPLGGVAFLEFSSALDRRRCSGWGGEFFLMSTETERLREVAVLATGAKDN